MWKYMLVAIVNLLFANAAQAAGGEHHGASLADALHLYHVIPFAGLLLCIAVLPMVARHWWESNRNQLIVALAWAAPILLFFGYHTTTQYNHDAVHGMTHAMAEYVSFIALLGSLFIISGGIFLRGDLEGTPKVNTAFLAIGALLSNLIGTTGASMLLIRPMLRTNQQREFVKHIPLFFIFLVSNIGGALTPIGDPPLFLGFLRGVPFFWTLQHLWPIWLLPVTTLLILFFVVDTWFYRKEEQAHVEEDKAEVVPLGIEGAWNFLLLGGVIACVLLLSPERDEMGKVIQNFKAYYAREIGMGLLAIISVAFTPKRLRQANGFTYGPILEVAALFIGIFITMIPATMLLEARGAELGITAPWQFFWSTGMLSSFLDNAPTYVTFSSMACGAVGANAENLATLIADPMGFQYLVAISVGAVFMGENSYIGNGPNFMVRAIAEEVGYKMPSFFGYMGWAAVVLFPVFGLVTLIFFL